MEPLIHLLSVRNLLGEGPVWQPEEQALYWVDIESKAYYRYLPRTGLVERTEIGLRLGVMRFRQRGGMIMATNDGIKFWDPTSLQLTSVINPEPDKSEARFNDGAIDPQGRFWAGTMTFDGSSSSRLYRLDPDLSLHVMETQVGVSNGIGWSLDGKSIYYTDSPAKVIYAYDFDPLTGDIANRRPFIHTPDEEGFPDGLIVDSQGFIWSARWGGWKISRYDPMGKLERVISVPVEFPSSCVFGGEDLTDLYITSAWIDLGLERKDTQPFSGDIFLLKTDIKGRIEPKFMG